VGRSPVGVDADTHLCLQASGPEEKQAKQGQARGSGNDGSTGTFAHRHVPAPHQALEQKVATLRGQLVTLANAQVRGRLLNAAGLSMVWPVSH
jgi:hypothetical protein